MTARQLYEPCEDGIVVADGPKVDAMPRMGESLTDRSTTHVWRRGWRFVLMFGAILAVLGVGATPGLAAAGAETQGAQLLRSVEDGGQTCGQLSDGQFAKIGEYVMGRMLGSTARHEAMDEQMRDASNEAQAHVFMGQRFADCASGKVPYAFGSMMGMMGNYSGANGMMGGGREGNGYRTGRMAGSQWPDGDASRRDGFDGNHMGGDWAWVVIVAMIAMMGGMGWMMWSMTRGAGNVERGSFDDPIELLKVRYARGDITSDEFQERRQAIEDAQS